MVAISQPWYNGSYTMAAKPIKTLELHYTMIQFLINRYIECRYIRVPTEADKGHELSLPSCRFRVVASKLSLPSCRFRVVASELSLPSCRFQVVASELSLPSCRFQLVASKLSLPSCHERRLGKEPVIVSHVCKVGVRWAFYSIYMFVWNLYASPLPDNAVTGTLKRFSCQFVRYEFNRHCFL